MAWSFYDKNGNVKQAAAGALVPSCSMYDTGGVVVATGAWTKLNLNTIRNQSVSTMGSTANNQIVIPTTGTYLVSGGFAANVSAMAAGTELIGAVWVNGATVAASASQVMAATTNAPGNKTTHILNLNAGDVVATYVWNNAVASVTTYGNLDVVKIDGAISVPVAYPASFVGLEIAYATVTAPVALNATATDVISSGAITYDGVSAIWIDFAAQSMQFSTGTAVGDNANLRILVDGVDVSGQVWLAQATVAATTSLSYFPIRLGFKYTPSAGSHTIKISGIKNAAGASTVQIIAGTGAASNAAAQLRITKVS
jgi:hypothetical protein